MSSSEEPTTPESVNAKLAAESSPDASSANENVADRVGRPAWAWSVILVVVALILGLAMIAPESGEAGSEIADQWQQSIVEWQGKYLVGASQFPGVTSKQLFAQAEPLNTGSIESRLRYVVLAGELIGAEKGAAHLEDLRRRIATSSTKTTDEQQAVIESLDQAYADFEAKRWNVPSLSDADRQLLIEHLGWFGRLALYPNDAVDKEQRQAVIADASMVVPITIVLVALAGLLGFVSLGGLVLFVVLASLRRLRRRMEAQPCYGGVYVETFAVWMVLHIVVGFVVQLAGSRWPAALIPLIALGLLLSGVAVLWPLARSVPWPQMTREIGLTRGRHVVLEALLGVFGWVSTLPVMFFVLLVTFGIASLFQPRGDSGDPFAPQEMPMHPIVEWVMQASITDKLLIAVIACVLAPVFEEIMFRGFLYRHLREATARWRLGASVAFSALSSSLLFAVIHPQGLIAVPALTTLAAAFCLLREWRGSLVAPITAHATNNGLMTAALFFLMS